MKRSCNCFLALLFCNFITGEKIIYINVHCTGGCTVLCTCTAGSESVSCAVDGTIRMAPEVVDASNYRLLQVCLFGEWSYVCSFRFNNIALNVTLHQLGYTGGGTYHLYVFSLINSDTSLTIRNTSLCFS